MVHSLCPLLFWPKFYTNILGADNQIQGYQNSKCKQSFWGERDLVGNFYLNPYIKPYLWLNFQMLIFKTIINWNQT